MSKNNIVTKVNHFLSSQKLIFKFLRISSVVLTVTFVVIAAITSFYVTSHLTFEVVPNSIDGLVEFIKSIPMYLPGSKHTTHTSVYILTAVSSPIILLGILVMGSYFDKNTKALKK